jgi:hypothetical protein
VPEESPFHFATDHTARGYGCYAIVDGGETYVLSTDRGGGAPGDRGEALENVGRPLLLVGGGGSVVAGVVLLVRGRRAD